ncbi:MAG TPA: DUF29 family protein [Acetobacteraceae bacterium]|jgi:hypothetical protein
MDDTSLYDSDILAWSEQQAVVLRGLAARGDLPNNLDLEHIVEEIESVGQGELVEVRVLLGRALTEIVLAWAAPDAEPIWERSGKLIGCLADAELRFTPTMADFVRLEDLWTSSVRHAVQRLEIFENTAAAARARTLDGSACPFSLAELLGERFGVRAALQKLNETETSASP